MDFTSQNLEAIDSFVALTHYSYFGRIPIVEGKTLLHMFPKGYIDENDLTNESTIRYQLIYKEWRKTIQVIMEKWDYNNLPKELDKYKIEKVILENGQGVLFKRYGKFYFTPFTINDKDLYDEPVEITTISNAEDFNGLKLKKGKFAIIRNNENLYSLFNIVIQPINAMIDVLSELNKNLHAASPKGLMIVNSLNDKGKELVRTLNKALKSNTTFFAINADVEDNPNLQRELILNKGEGNPWIPIELRDRTDELIKQFLFWQSHIKELIGLSVNYTSDKKERNVVGEVQVQQDTSFFMNAHMFNIRKNDLDYINKLFNLDINLEWNEISSPNIKDPSDTNKGDNYNE